MNRMQPSTFKQRSTNIEILRLLAIFFVVISHFSVHSQFEFFPNKLSINQLVVQMGAIGELGVSIFIIISGFFSVSQKQTVKKFITILCEVWLYNVLVVIAVVLFKGNLGLSEIVKNLVPIYNIHWFAYVYLFLYILMPYINKFLVSISKTDLQKLLLTLGFFWGVVYTFTGADLNYSYLVWFVYLYMLGAYLRLYGREKPNKKVHVVILSICLIALFSSTLLIDLAGLSLGFFPRYSNLLYSLHSPLILGSAVALFQIFRGTEVGFSKAINTISSTTFAIYLISDHSLVRPWLWNSLFNNSQYSDSSALFLIGILESIVICMVCSAIDLLRQKFFATKLLQKVLQAVSEMVDKCFKKSLLLLQKYE